MRLHQKKGDKMKILQEIGCGCICLVLFAGCAAQTQEETREQIVYDEFQEWLAREYEDQVGENTLAIVIRYSDEMFSLNLSDEEDGSINVERMSGNNLAVRGRKDEIRGYFEGCVEWEEELCIVNLETMEYVVLEGNLKSFTLGDYYVSCQIVEEQEDGGQKAELLVFYCPA